MTARQRILDAAADVMSTEGLARTTTKAIARAAGCSEALLYKNFLDKEEIFLAVLSERMPRLDLGDGLVGTGNVDQNLRSIVEQLLAFYVRTFPVAASIFSSHELLRVHRSAMQSHGAGPQGPALLVQRYLDGEAALGRLAAGSDTETAARALVGAALLEGFLAAYDGLTEVPDQRDRAERLVAMITPGLGLQRP